MCHHYKYFQISSAAPSFSNSQLIPIDFSYEVVDTVDTPSDVTDPDTLIKEQSFSQAAPVEHHPRASDEVTSTTALQSTHETDQRTTGECSVYNIGIHALHNITAQQPLLMLYHLISLKEISHN